MATMADFLDEDSLQKMFKRMNVDQVNQQATSMADPGSPPPNPYGGGGGKKGILGTIGSIAPPVMKLGGMALSAAGMPYFGVPLSIAGGAAGGGSSGEGLTGALKGGLKSGITEAASFGLGSWLDALKTPVNDPINLASKGLTIPGRRMNPIDVGNLTIPASPKSFGGGMS